MSAGSSVSGAETGRGELRKGPYPLGNIDAFGIRMAADG